MLDRVSVNQTWADRSKVDPGVTCVAFFHERRPREFDALIDRLQDSLRRRLARWLLRSEAVRLAPGDRIHATLIGMEASREHGELINTNWRRSRTGAESRPMDLDGFAGYLRRVGFPIRLRFGGFAPADANPYDPRPPFERSFAIRRDGLIVAVGWPIRDGVIRPALLDFRKGAEPFNIVHKYHMKETDRDNDAFLVLGALTPMPWEDRGGPRDGTGRLVAALEAVQEEIRESLRDAPMELDLERAHCVVVRYRTADLAAVPERDILPWDAVTAEALRRLYL
jgi:hypothetical protein